MMILNIPSSYNFLKFTVNVYIKIFINLITDFRNNLFLKYLLTFFSVFIYLNITFIYIYIYIYLYIFI
jgi:hypothetical protein